VDKTRFNQELLLDLMALKDDSGKTRSVLHIVDVATRFSAAIFLPNVDAGTVWNCFLKAWASTYIGYPESMLTDQGSVFTSANWENACETVDIHLRNTGSQSHNSLSANEKYHDTLRTIYNKVRHEYPKLPVDVSLALSVKAMNDTVGPDGLVPSLLVFGVLPKLPSISPRDFPEHKERVRAMMTARKKYEQLVSLARVQLGILKRPPPAADIHVQPGEFVYVYREHLKAFTGPHMVATVDGKNVRVHVGENTGPRQFNLARSSQPLFTRGNMKMTL